MCPGRICWLRKVIKQWSNRNRRNTHISNLKCILTVCLYLTDTLLKHLNVKGLKSNHFWWTLFWSWSIGYVAWFLTITASAGTKYFAHLLFKLLLTQCNLCLLMCTLHLKCVLIFTTACNWYEGEKKCFYVCCYKMFLWQSAYVMAVIVHHVTYTMLFVDTLKPNRNWKSTQSLMTVSVHVHFNCGVIGCRTQQGGC